MTEAFNELIKELNDENTKNGKGNKNEADVDWLNNPDNLIFNSRDEMASALAFWKYRELNKLAVYNSQKCVILVTYKINPALKVLKKE